MKSPVALVTSLSKAKKFCDQGNFNHALVHLSQIPGKERDSEVHQLERHCRRMLLRKYWKQGRYEDFAKTMSGMKEDSWLALVHARLKGGEQLTRLADEVEEGTIKSLALSSITEDLKRALLVLRRQPEWQFLAEGWVALLKGDLQQAEELFEKASVNAPTQAKAGRELIGLIDGGIAAIGPLLSSLKPYASRFPQLTKAMGWDGSSKDLAHKIEAILYQTPLELLQNITQSQLPRPIQGWIELRIGDYLATNATDQAIFHWDKAFKLNSELKIDVLKRRFLSALRKDSPHEPKAAFFEFYHALKKASPDQARSFVEHLIFTSGHRIENWLTYGDLRSSRSKNWMVEATTEMKLLWLTLSHRQALIHFNRVVGLSSGDIASPCGCNKEEWQALFASLDTFYSHQEKYLKSKLAATLLLGDHQMVVDAAMALLLQNPQLKDEVLPTFIKYATIKEVDKITALRRLFPRDPDLIRLTILYTQPKKVWLDRLDDYATSLSASLLAVLKAELAFDQQLKPAQVRRFFPDSTLFGCDREADWRFVALICNKKLGLPAKSINVLLHQLAADSKTKHEFFLNMVRYGYALPRESVLNKWCQDAPKDWQSYFHRARYLLETGQFFEALDDLDQARGYISSYEPESSVIDDTMTFYEAHLPEIEQLIDLERAIETFIGKENADL